MPLRLGTSCRPPCTARRSMWGRQCDLVLDCTTEAGVDGITDITTDLEGMASAMGITVAFEDMVFMAGAAGGVDASE